MSKGSKVIPVRIPAELLALIQEEIERSQSTRADAPYDMSTFIRKALTDKLAHSKRSRSKGKRKPLQEEATLAEVQRNEAVNQPGQVWG